MSLAGATSHLTAEELHREPRDLGVIAYFDGYTFGAYGNDARNQTFPRRLTRSEERCWREGFTEGRTERVCHSWHGFTPCTHDHPPTITTEENP